MDGPGSIVTDNTTMIEFILKFRELECLWKSTHPEYGNKHRRLECLKELLVVLKKGRPDADIYTVKAKINSIRSNFNKQLKKVREKLQYSTDSVNSEAYYENMVKNYSLLKFLMEGKPQKKEKQELQEPNKETIYLEEDCIEDCNDDSNEDSHEEYLMKDDQESYTSTTPTKEHIVIFPRQSSKKSRLAKLNMESNYETEEAESSTLYTPQYSSFGEHIAEKLRCMPNKMAIYCQKIINDAIFHAEIGDLNKTSRIVTDFELP